MGSRQKFQNNVPGKHDTKTEASSNGQNSFDSCACTIIPLRNVHRDGKKSPVITLANKHCASGPLRTGDSTESLGTPCGAALFCFSSAGTASLHLLFHMEEDPTCGVGNGGGRRRTRTMYAQRTQTHHRTHFAPHEDARGRRRGRIPSSPAAAAVPPDAFWHENDPLCLRKRWLRTRITSIMDLH